LNTESNLAQ